MRIIKVKCGRARMLVIIRRGRVKTYSNGAAKRMFG